eukprot:CAMPEP_0113880148 /NCGR_PEP_ID=MMETSP0780_2-20120614/7626_1 /TAXON_ID=652834 /ORGANISM="Palpitomonas bilix" /LENGTH=176 /DNA_ID=CAMNT_0000866795 /DNA_START=203 /DNA_END=732 /DNA_ORIENTATION=- /assembly_acc=CAM_ASM_000599
MDSMRSGMKDAAEKKSEEMFMKQVKELSEKPTFLLRDFLAQNQEIAKMAGMRGFRSHLPWMKSQAEKDPNAKSTELQLKILEKLDDDELDHKVDVVGPRRKRIAQAAGVSVGDVKELLKRYKAAERMHKLIRKRKAEGLPLPANADEAADMMMQSVSVSPPAIATGELEVGMAGAV